MSEAPTIAKPTGAPNSWFAILLGFTTLVIAGALAALMIRQHLEGRPLDLTEHSRDLATKTRMLLETNRIPVQNIEVVHSEARRSDTSVWWYYELVVDLPDELNARTIEQLMMDDLNKRNVVVSRIESSDRLRKVSLVLAGNEFARVELRGGSETPMVTTRDFKAATERIATETYQVLRRRLAPTARFNQHPSEEQRDATATWSHTLIDITGIRAESGLRGLADILVETMGNREVSVQSNGETITLRYLGYPCVDVSLGKSETNFTFEAGTTTDESTTAAPVIEDIPLLDEPPAPEPAPLEPEESDTATPAEVSMVIEEQAPRLPPQPAAITQADVRAKIKDPKKPRIAIIVDDGGNNEEVDNSILALDTNLTLAILPFTPFGRSTAKKGHELGFEIMLHMPMESDNDRVSHPGMVLTSMDAEEIASRFTEALDEMPQISGVNNHTGSAFTASAEDLSVVMKIMSERGLYFVDSLTSKVSAVRSVARDLEVPTAARDVFLDNEADPEYIHQQFDELLAKADKRGWAIGICHFRPVTAEVIPDLLAKMEEAGVGLVHASELVH